MNVEEIDRLYELACQRINKTGWHWFHYHFNFPIKPFAFSIIKSCRCIDEAAEGVGTLLLKELSSIGGREKYEDHFEQLLQKLSEILVLERLVSINYDERVSFEYEPSAFKGGPRPDFVVNFSNKRLVVEVKTPAQLKHNRKRAVNSVQLPCRSGVSLEQVKEVSDDGNVTLPRDNTILDFLLDAERKFESFKNNEKTTTLLVIVWDDYIYEPISALLNPYTGLLTNQSYKKDERGKPFKFLNIDGVIVLRHLNYFISASREEALVDRLTALDFGDNNALPNVLFLGHGGSEIPYLITEGFRAFYQEDIKNIGAEYKVHEVVHWL